MKNIYKLMLAFIFCMTAGLSAHSDEDQIESNTSKSSTKNGSSTVRDCIKNIKAQISDLREQASTICETDETATACLAAKEQISALRKNIKACFGTVVTPAPAPAPVPALASVRASCPH